MSYCGCGCDVTIQQDFCCLMVGGSATGVQPRSIGYDVSLGLLVNCGKWQLTPFPCSELLVNFACATRARRLDISNILVFATDEETKELAESVGLAAYYDERVRFVEFIYISVAWLHCRNPSHAVCKRILATFRVKQPRNTETCDSPP